MPEKFSHKKHFNELKFTNNNNTNDLLNKIRSIDKENLKCCDCQSTQDVDWISINLLCVLCIKCSGVHRSLGSHISKIRSLTLDKFDDNLELIYLITHFTSNKFCNEIYECNLQIQRTIKINPYCNDSQRLKFISDKYKDKLFVKKPIRYYLHDDNDDDKLNKIIEKLRIVLQSNSVWKLQYLLARLININLKQLSIEYLQKGKGADVTLFQDSLKYYVERNDQKLFVISEYLLWNDMIIDKEKDIISNNKSNDDDTISTEMINYWNSKIKVFGTYDSNQTYRSPTLSPIMNNSSSSTNTPSSGNSNTNMRSMGNIPSRSKSKKRWSLNYIPKSSTQNIITFHNALKSIKDNATKK